jgi:Protein of unknown function (DUF3309)
VWAAILAGVLHFCWTGPARWLHQVAGTVATPLSSAEEAQMVTILLVILILMLLGAIPAWPHSRSWGYGPSGGLGLVVIVLLILLLTGRV